MCTYLCENSIWAALDLLDKKPGGLFQFVALSSHQGDECSFLQRLFGERQANASRGTCDEDMLSRERWYEVAVGLRLLHLVEDSCCKNYKRNSKSCTDC